jgi:uncharacterized protein (TIGR02444 family)
MEDTKQLTAELWQWGDNCYGANKDLCLSLQDRHGVNINLLLLAHYLDRQTHLDFDQTQWQQLCQTTQDWDRHLLGPYRRLRRLAKAHLTADEYQQMLDVELMLERKQQAKLLHAVKGLTAIVTATDQGSNLETYLGLMGLSDLERQEVEFVESRQP